MYNFQNWLNYKEALQAGDDNQIQDVGATQLKSSLCPPNDPECMATLQRLKEMLGDSYEAFVQELGEEIIRDKKFLKALKIITNNGQRIKLSKISVPVAQLKPTQREIAMDKTLKTATGDATWVQQFLAGGSISVGQKNIITGGGGQFIIDGHHRWAKLYSVNPGASITALDIGSMKAEDALKIVQVGIATAAGGLPSASVAGATNLLTANENVVKGFVVNNLKKDVKKVYKEYFAKRKPQQPTAPQAAAPQPAAPPQAQAPAAPMAQQQPTESFFRFYQKMLKEEGEIVPVQQAAPVTPQQPGMMQPAMPGADNPQEELKQKIANFIWQNITAMQSNNQPLDPKAKRDVMPQTGDAEGWEKRTTQDLLPQNAHHRPAGKLYKEWQTLAGL